MSPEIGSPLADSVMAQADLDLAAGDGGKTTGNLRSGSLRKRGRAGKASVEGNGEATPAPTRSSQRKRAKPEAAAEVESAPAKSAPSAKSKAKGKAVAPEEKETVKAKAVRTKVKKGKERAIEDDPLEEELPEEVDEEEGDDAVVEIEVVPVVPKRKAVARKKAADDVESCFIGDPVPVELAKKLWPHRYQKKEAEDSSSQKFEEDPDEARAKRHYRQAKVDDVIYNLNDDVYVKAGDGEPDFIGRIIEFFEGVDKQCHFTSRWFYRAVDTVIEDHHHHIDPRRVFLSDDKNVNVLDCIVSKIKIVRVSPNIDLDAKKETIPDCDLYYDMSYSSKYSTFAVLPSDNEANCVGNSSPASSTSTLSSVDTEPVAMFSTPDVELSLLDLYSGCGAMSTGLCLGAKLSGINLVTKWAVDFNEFASESLRMNHPETQVRTEKAEDFLQLLREWEKMCNQYGLLGTEVSSPQVVTSDVPENMEKTDSVDESDEDEAPIAGEEFEVGEFLDICYGDPNEINKNQLMFKVRWKGYGPDEDTWEPLEGLGNCDERIEAFVRNGFQKKILPLPGMVDTICGGPPCQGISGFNRFRNAKAPLEDEKNKQMLVFMEIVEFLKPKHVLMENVVDILKFAKGFLGRYALCRLVQLNYQARLGILAAGSFGLPQFRMRCFLWGAQPSEKLPQFPLPTHAVVTRGGAPVAFEPNVVALDENEHPVLKRALHLEDAISDMPPVDNFEKREEMEYRLDPRTDFQRSIRLTREALLGIGDTETLNGTLFDHIPYKLNEDDFQRVCRIPKAKGANFRNLPGLTVGENNVIERIPNILELLPSGKPLVPEYALTFVKGKSLKPFGRLWWDETVSTVVTRAEPHNQAILHPEQDRVLTVRENARLQGFPDYYKLYGPVSQKYMQVGNAVAVPVARALGYGLGLARQGLGDDLPVFALPPSFPKPVVRSTVAVEMVEG